ncbi:hypothetical protein JRQ81_008655 [Phrynocephalus forsythii]|uniref:Uncharacterized protein n=1 Tax=Phrynocephalus forsythii TaxID=171643 RepID=A0A9Q0XB08_9SAUR|nr:hypothetical protein JRQ81_008655 [Phrynocephalus forsythii]
MGRLPAPAGSMPGRWKESHTMAPAISSCPLFRKRGKVWGGGGEAPLHQNTSAPSSLMTSAWRFCFPSDPPPPTTNLASLPREGEAKGPTLLFMDPALALAHQDTLPAH